jgi:hypothetical protein
MKTTLQSVLVMLLIASFGFAAEAKTTKNVDTKDALMSFVLEKANTYSDKTEVAIGKAFDFAVAEIPLVMKEFLMWRTVQHCFTFFIFSVVSTLIYFYFIRKCFGEQWRDDSDEVSMVGGVVGTIAIFFMIGAAICEFLNMMQILIAPRIYLIEQGSALLK